MPHSPQKHFYVHHFERFAEETDRDILFSSVVNMQGPWYSSFHRFHLQTQVLILAFKIPLDHMYHTLALFTL